MSARKAASDSRYREYAMDATIAAPMITMRSIKSATRMGTTGKMQPPPTAYVDRSPVAKTRRPEYMFRAAGREPQAHVVTSCATKELSMPNTKATARTAATALEKRLPAIIAYSHVVPKTA
ncbi:hypothetical protein [Microbacterium rhizosphaerae]|uniref:Uncharacterized protein n=1 Tax=Microbacterium rhizosphaerae TaxID=1678237 RepID=A0ABZ0SJX7_9MICO|nr:hypothetical protein [Microbacterium rhizosphaerae]WPR89697.1 hypothetical protein SM116_18365 [Microbacterium rhizosphaerae]